MATKTTSTIARSAFMLAGPVITATIPPPSDSLSRRTDLHMRIHHAHLKANVRRIQSLGLGLPSTMRQSQRTTRAVAHTIPPTTTTTAVTTTHLPTHAPASRRPLATTVLNGLPTPPETPAPAPASVPQTQTQTQTCPMLPTRRSRTRAARTGFHGVGAGLSFGLNTFGGDDPVLTPRASESFHADDDVRVRRTPHAPARGEGSGGGAGYFRDVSTTMQVEGEGEENVFRAIC